MEAGIDNFQIDNNPNMNVIPVSLSNIFIYPNPTVDGIINIEGSQVPYNYALYNLSGKLIKTGKKNQIQLNDRGVYILKIQSGKEL